MSMGTKGRTVARARAAAAVCMGGLLGLAAGAAAAQSTEDALTMPLTDPSRPATLEVSVHGARIAVNAHDGAEIVISTRYDGAEDEEPEPRDGLRRIPNTSIGVTAEERDNIVRVTTDFTPRAVELVISVPRRTSVRARAVNGGDLVVTGVAGEHELNNVNGGIVATDIAGSAVVGTTNGDVRVVFTEIQAGKAMSFSTFNGDVDVTFPPDLAANLRVNSGRGELRTDFDVEVRQEPPVVERSSDGGGQRVRLERTMHVVVGGGGPDMQFRTFNGDVRIRRR